MWVSGGAPGALVSTRVFSAIAGHDVPDSGSANVPVVDHSVDVRRGLDGSRIGVRPDCFFHHLQAPVHAAIKDALDALTGLGAGEFD